MNNALVPVLSSVLGIADTRPVTVSSLSRREGMYLIGATGQGKSTEIASFVLQDVDEGRGVCLIDPHGDVVDSVVARMTSRFDDVILIDLSDDEHVPGINLYDCSDNANIRLVQKTVNSVLHIFAKLYDISRNNPVISLYLRNGAYTLIANPGTTLVDLPRLFTDEVFRLQMIGNVTHYGVLLFWREFEKVLRNNYTYLNEVRPILNKIDEFLQPIQRTIFGQAKTTLPLRQIMDTKKLLFIKLDEELDDLSSLFGTTIISHLLLAAYSRRDTPPDAREQFHIYADEFQLYANDDFGRLFKEARKYGLGLCISHQVFEDIDLRVKAACKQAATIMAFRVSSDNAKEIAGSFDCSPIPGIPRFEPLKTPIMEPLQYMVTHGVHPLEKTRVFVETYGKMLVEGVKKEEEDRRRYQSLSDRLVYSTSDWKITPPPLPMYPGRYCELTVNILNSLFYQAMLAGKEKRPLPDITHTTFIPDYFIRATYAQGIGYLRAVDTYTNFRVTAGKQNLTDYALQKASLPALRTRLQQQEVEKIHALYRHRDTLLEQLRRAYATYLDIEASVLPEPAWWKTPKERDAEITKRIRERVDTKREIAFDRMGYASHTLMHWRIQFTVSCLKTSYYVSVQELPQKAAQLRALYAQKQKEIDEELTLITTIEQEQPAYASSLVEITTMLQEVMHELSIAPIEGDSGLTQEVPTEIPTTEVEGRIANSLTLLPKYTARVRCETGEFVITTLPLPQGVDQKTLQDRLRTITDRNLKDKYLRKRSDVEIELDGKTPAIQPLPPPAPKRVPQKTTVTVVASPPTPTPVSPPVPQRKSKRVK